MKASCYNVKLNKLFSKSSNFFSVASAIVLIMAVVAVLLIHIDSSQLGNIKPRYSLFVCW